MRILRPTIFDITYGRWNHFCVSALRNRGIPLGHMASRIFHWGAGPFRRLRRYLAILETLGRNWLSGRAPSGSAVCVTSVAKVDHGLPVPPHDAWKCILSSVGKASTSLTFRCRLGRILGKKRTKGTRAVRFEAFNRSKISAIFSWWLSNHGSNDGRFTIQISSPRMLLVFAANMS